MRYISEDYCCNRRVLLIHAKQKSAIIEPFADRENCSVDFSTQPAAIPRDKPRYVPTSEF